MIVYRVTAEHKTLKGTQLYLGQSMEKAFEIFGKAVETNQYEAIRISRVTTVELDSWTKE